MALRSALSTFVILAALALLPSAARAQQLLPVDQAVADIDPLARSLRHLDSGLGLQGQQTALYQIVPAPGTAGLGMGPIYYRVAQGYTATFNRLDYFVRQSDGTLGYDMSPRKDGQFVEIIPSNTVFDLRPYGLQPHLGAANQGGSPATQPAASSNPAQHSATVITSGRVEPTRTDNRINAVKLSATPAQR